METMKLKLISKLLSSKNKDEGLTVFRELLYNSFLEFANKESSIANEAEMILKLQEIEKDLELVSSYSNLYKKNIIAVGGGFSAGKSEFISSFISNPILKLPIGVVPTTAIPTYVFNEEKDVFLGTTNKGGVIKLDEIDKNFHKNLSHEFIKSFEFNLKEIMPYMMIGTNIDYENLCFIDTPGYNPASIEHGFTSEDVNTAKSFLENVNILIWLIGADANGTISQSDLEFLESVNLENKQLYIVYNKADLKSPDDIEDILDSIEENLEDNDIEYCGISAYSSVMKNESNYRQISIDEFLKTSDVSSNKHIDIYKQLKFVYDAYKNAIIKDIEDKKNIAKNLHSLSLDIFEGGVDTNNPSFDTIENLKSLFKTTEEETLLKELNKIFQEFKKSIDIIFNKELEFDFDVDEKEEVNNESKDQESLKDNKNLYALNKDNKYGFVNKNGEFVIEPQFDYAFDFSEDGLARIKKDGKYGFVNKNGEFIIEPQFDYALDFVNGFAVIVSNEKWGFINKAGEVVIEPQFDYALDFVNGFAVIVSNEKYGLINEKGEVVIEPQFDYLDSCEDDGLYIIKQDGKYGVINKEGKIIVKPKYSTLVDFKNGFAKISKREEKNMGGFFGNRTLNINKYGVINNKGEIILKPIFDDIFDFSKNGFAVVKKDIDLLGNYKYGIIDGNGEFIVDFKFDDLSQFSDNGFAIAKKGEKTGIIDESGKFVVKVDFDYGYSSGFDKKGLAEVIKNKKRGFINEKGEFIIKPIFDDNIMIYSFDENGLAKIKKNEKYGLINEKGEVVIEPQFDSLFEFDENGLAKIKKNEKYGVINKEDKVIILPKFNEITLSNEVIIVKFNENKGLVSLDGEYLTFEEEDLK